MSAAKPLFEVEPASNPRPVTRVAGLLLPSRPTMRSGSATGGLSPLDSRTSLIAASEVAFTVLGVAQPAGSKRGFVSGGRVRVVDANPKAASWKSDVSTIAYEAMRGRPLLTGPLALDATFYIVRPKGHHGVRGIRPSAPAFPTTRPDLLKLTRGLEDACTSVVWRDDSLIVDEVLRKRYAADGEPARVEVVVRVLA